MKDLISSLLDSLTDYYHLFIHSLPRVVLALFVLVLAVLIARKMKAFARNRFQKNARDPLLSQFLSEIVRLVIIVISVSIVLGIAGLGGAASKVLAGAGITAFIFGFAFKDIGENFLAGVILAFKRPFHVGDIIESNGQRGKVAGMTLRETSLKTFDGKDVYMPNSMILNTPLINYTIDVFNRIEFTVAVPASSDIPKAIDIIKNILLEKKEVLKNERSPLVYVDTIATPNVTLMIRFWIEIMEEEEEAVKVKSDVIQKTLAAFRQVEFIK